MSTIVTYSTVISSLSTGDGTVNLTPPIILGANRGGRRCVRLIKAAISTSLPNVFQIGPCAAFPVGFNNGLIVVTRDNWATSLEIQLPNGVYEDLTYVENAVNDTVSSWWTDPNKPGFTIRNNLADGYVYVTIDSTALSHAGHSSSLSDGVAQLGIDFSQTGCSNPIGVNVLLGFKAVQKFSTDDTFSGDQLPQLDWYGNIISVNINGFGPLSLKNGLASQEICSIPLAGVSSTANLYLYPQAGIPSPIINLQMCPEVISSFYVTFTGSRSDNGVPRSVYFTQGEVDVDLELSWS